MTMCNCLSEINQKLVERTGDPKNALSSMLTLEGNELKEYPALILTFRNKKRDGTFQQKLSTTKVKSTYCPFCGIKFSDEEQDNDK